MHFRGFAAALAALLVSSVAAAQQGAPMPPTIPQPQDIAYPGTITLDVDATDTARGIIRVREAVPVSGGPLTLLYPQWLPGNHGPRGPPKEPVARRDVFQRAVVLQAPQAPVGVHAHGPGIGQAERGDHGARKRSYELLAQAWTQRLATKARVDA